MEDFKVYVKTNDAGLIIDVNSSAFITDPTGWTEIDSGTSRRHYHAQGQYFEKPFITEFGAYRYRLTDGVPAECTTEEIAAQEAACALVAVPSAQDDTDAMIVDHEYRLTLLELGLI